MSGAAPRLAAIVLGAGLSRRMGGENKLLRPYRGRPLIAWAVAAALGSRAQEVALVTGRDAEAVRAAAGWHAKLRFAHNPQAEEGLAGSLKIGLEAVRGADAVAVLLGDMPEIDADLVDRLFEAYAPRAYAAVPVAGDVMGNPVVLGREAIADCAALTGDRGARKTLEANAARLVRVAVAGDAVLRDVDVPEDFVRALGLTPRAARSGEA